MKKLTLITSASLFVFAALTISPASSHTGSDKTPVTFTKDVAPILQKRCEECHRDGGVAPMAFTTYEQARPWARSIKEKSVSREMPPFHAAGAVGRYQDDPRLTDAEIATITRWVDGGAPRGDKRDMPAARVWKTEWKNGQPDLVLKVQRPYTVKPSAKDQ